MGKNVKNEMIDRIFKVIKDKDRRIKKTEIDAEKYARVQYVIEKVTKGNKKDKQKQDALDQMLAAYMLYFVKNSPVWANSLTSNNVLQLDPSHTRSFSPRKGLDGKLPSEDPEQIGNEINYYRWQGNSHHPIDPQIKNLAKLLLGRDVKESKEKFKKSQKELKKSKKKLKELIENTEVKNEKEKQLEALKKQLKKMEELQTRIKNHLKELEQLQEEDKGNLEKLEKLEKLQKMLEEAKRVRVIDKNWFTWADKNLCLKSLLTFSRSNYEERWKSHWPVMFESKDKDNNKEESADLIVQYDLKPPHELMSMTGADLNTVETMLFINRRYSKSNLQKARSHLLKVSSKVKTVDNIKIEALKDKIKEINRYSKKQKNIVNYKQRMLTYVRDTMEQFYTELEKKSGKKGMVAKLIEDKWEKMWNGETLAKDRGDGSYEYPCIMVNPSSKSETIKIAQDNAIYINLEKFWEKTNPGWELAIRRSFGHLHPTADDFGPSDPVRLWPGLGAREQWIRSTESITIENIKESPIFEALRCTRNSAIQMINLGKRLLKKVDKNTDNYLLIDLCYRLTKLMEWCTRIDQIEDASFTKFIKEKVEEKWVAETHRQVKRLLDNLNEGIFLTVHLLYGIDSQKVIRTTNKLITEWKRQLRESYEDFYSLEVFLFTRSGMAAYVLIKDMLRGCTSDISGTYYEGSILTEQLREDNLLGEQFIYFERDLAYNHPDPNELKLKLEMPSSLNKKNLNSVLVFDTTNVTREEVFAYINKSNNKKKLNIQAVILYESLTKHFQMGMGKSTLGRLEIYTKKGKSKLPPNLEQFIKKNKEKKQDDALHCYCKLQTVQFEAYKIN